MPGAKSFGDGPGLRDAASRSEWRVAIEDFAERAEPVRINLSAEWLEEMQGCSAISVDAEMCQRKRPEQPAPRSTLMIGGIALPRAARVPALVPRFAGREAAQTVTGEQMLRADIYDGFLLRRCERADGQRYAENLVGAKRGVVADSGRINHVEAARALRVPELLKTSPGLRGKLFVVLDRCAQHSREASQ